MLQRISILARRWRMAGIGWLALWHFTVLSLGGEHAERTIWHDWLAGDSLTGEWAGVRQRWETHGVVPSFSFSAQEWSNLRGDCLSAGYLRCASAQGLELLNNENPGRCSELAPFGTSALSDFMGVSLPMFEIGHQQPLAWLHRLAPLGFLLLGGCVLPPNQLTLVPGEAETKTVYQTTKVLTGKASYYYGRWIGRKTANGEIYRATDVTAAHKTLPFNTMVRITNLQNGKSVVVRINNRGPYIRGRILDLSLEAAKAIEMTKAGVVPVRAEILEEIEVVVKPVENVSPPTWWVAWLEAAREQAADDDAR